MADFAAAFERTMRFEGGYSSDPDDSGGETYCGIARRFHPRWSGWRTVDRLKGGRRFEAALSADGLLASSVRRFYREQFWDVLAGADIADEAVAQSLFDCGVQCGPRRAARLLQQALGLLARESSRRTKLRVDGIIGPETLSALAEQVARDGSAQALLSLYALLRGELLLSRVRDDISQRRFLRGWLRRIVSQCQ
jgi:lysozyme family protein